MLHRFSSLDKQRLLPGLLLPNEIVTARIADLACSYRTAAVYAAAEVYLDWPIGAGAIGRRDYSHRQLALRPNRSSKLVAGGGGVPRLIVDDVERPRSPVRALA
jgi:hypothetical protein